MLEKFGQSNNSQKHIQQELEAEGITHESNWKESLVDGYHDQVAVKLVKEDTKNKELSFNKINDRVWQKQSDEAFLNNDYKLIKALKKVRPFAGPNQELVSTSLNKLIAERPKNWSGSFAEIVDIAEDIELDSALVAKEYNSLFNTIEDQNHFNELMNFKKVIAYTPSFEIIQNKYRDILFRYHNTPKKSLISSIKKLTGVNPDQQLFQEVVATGDLLEIKEAGALLDIEITSQIIQQAYEVQLEKGIFNADKISSIYEKPSQDLVQRAYHLIIAQNDGINKMISLQRVTDVKPVFTASQLRPIFEKYISNNQYGRAGYIGVESIIELSGVIPPVDLIEKQISKIINNWRDNQSRITSELARLADGVGSSFKIPDSIIQDYYQKFISENNAFRIINLYNALSVKPAISREQALNLIENCLGLENKNIINRLSEILEIKLEFSSDQIKLKYQEALDDFYFGRVISIQEVTGVAPDQKLVKEAIEDYIRKQDFKDLSGFSKNKIIETLKDFSIKVDDNDLLSFYESIIVTGETKEVDISQLNDIFGCKIPASLVQNFYQAAVKTDNAWITMINLKNVYELSGNVKPDFSIDELKDINLSNLKDGLFNKIEWLTELTGVVIKYTDNDLDLLCQEFVAKGDGDRAAAICEFTGFNWNPDKEENQVVSNKIDKYLEELVNDANYYNPNNILDQILGLLKISKMKIDKAQVQIIYQHIFSEKEYSVHDINLIIKRLGIEPELPAEFIQEQITKLLTAGQVYKLDRFLNFCKVDFDSSQISLAYNSLLDRVVEYEDDWYERVEKLYKISKTNPSEAQLSRIFINLIKDRHVSNYRYDRIGNIIKLLEKTFVSSSFDITTVAQDVYRELFKANDFVENLDYLELLIKATKTIPSLSPTEIEAVCSKLLAENNFIKLKIIKKLLNLDVVLITSEVLQKQYRDLAISEDISKFYELYELTSVPPEFSPEQIDLIYKKVINNSDQNEKLEKILGVFPSEAVVQDYFYALLSNNNFSESAISLAVEKYKIKISQETVQKAVLSLLDATTIRRFSGFLNIVDDISKVSGLPVQLEASLISPLIEKILDVPFVSDGRYGYFVEDIASWFEKCTGQKPFQKIIDLSYYQTAINSINAVRNNENSEWSSLQKKYGPPTDAVVNRVYFDQLTLADKFRTPDNIEYIQSLAGVSPRLRKIAESVSVIDDKITKNDVDSQYQALLEKELSFGNINEINQLENLFAQEIVIKPDSLQVWYAKILMLKNDKQTEIYNFLFNKTGIGPSQEIISAKFRDIFENSFSVKDVYNFQELCGYPPSQEMIQVKVKEIFTEYVKYDGYYQNDEGNAGYDHYRENTIFNDYISLIAVTGTVVKFDYNDTMDLYKYCISHGFDQKLEVIKKETGFDVDYEFIKYYLLDDKDFDNSVPFGISEAQLDQHFSDTSNRNIKEYERIYKIFACFDYYQKILTELEKKTDVESKQQVISILTVMGLRDLNKDDNYIATKEKLMSFIEDEQAPITKALALSLSELAKKGDVDLLRYFTSIIYNRSKLNRDDKEQEGVMNLSQLQEVALRTLFHVNNSTANESLLSLLSLPDIDSRVRSLILNNLVTKKRGFFPSNMAAWVKSELTNKKSDFAWDSLKYFQATNKISSADLKRKINRQLDSAFGDFKAKGLSPAEEQKINSSNIPDNIFLSIWEFTKGDKNLLQQFDNLYKITKSSADRDSLLFGIVNSLSMNKKTLQAAVNKLNGIELASPGNAKELAAVLKTLSFLDTVERELGEFGEDVLNILDGPVESLSNLNEVLKEVAVKKIKEILPNENIDTNIIENLWSHWGNLEPIFVYAGKMAPAHRETLKLVAEMVSNMDAPNYSKWKNWRYDISTKSVQEQIGSLNKDQLEVWKDNHFAELGDIMIASTPSGKPKQIIKSLEEALNNGHIFCEEVSSSNRHQFIHEKMTKAYSLVNKHPGQREVIFDGLIAPLKSDLEKIDDVIRYNNLPKLEQLLETFTAGNDVTINAKTKNSLTLFSQLLSKEQAREVENNYKIVENNKVEKANPLEILSAGNKIICESKIEEIRVTYEKISQEKTLDNYGVNEEQLSDQKQLYQKRQELKALLDLYRVSALDIKRIATNRISDRIDKKGETLITVVESLKNYFKDNQAFLQDIENIKSVISQKEDLSSKRRLAMMLTDNPQVLFQIGKYPIGCGSCQNYEGSPDWNKSLAAYISDSHIKVAYLIDLNKLPNELIQAIDDQGFEKVKNLIPQQNLLEASVARSVTKIVKVADGNEPVLFVEPTYSSINKGDLGMDKYFNIFLELMVSDPMNIRLVRGGGSEIVEVPNSCNPSGQYEDCAAGNDGHAGMGIQFGKYKMSARFIDRFSPLTDMDKQLAEKISGVAY